MQVLKPTNDVAFKKIFSHEQILINFINVICERTGPDVVTEIRRDNTELIKERRSDKLCVPDVICTCSNGTTFIVEMQILNQSWFINRIQYYCFKAIVNQLQEGRNYDTLKPIVVIALCELVIFSNSSMVSTHRMMDIETGSNELNLPEFRFVQIPKFDCDPTTYKDWWFLFFKRKAQFESNEMELITSTFPVIAQAVHALERVNFTDAEYAEYNVLEDLSQQEVNRLDFAKNEGRSEARIEIARNMKSMGVESTMIARCTELLVEFIESLEV